MAEKKICSKRPRQTEGKDPDRGEPHAGVIVEISCFDKLFRPVVEPFNSRRTIFGIGDCPLIVEAVAVSIALLEKAGPNRGAHLHPALPIGAPEHLLNKFLGDRQAVIGKHFGKDFIFGDDAVPYILNGGDKLYH